MLDVLERGGFINGKEHPYRLKLRLVPEPPKNPVVCVECKYFGSGACYAKPAAEGNKAGYYHTAGSINRNNDCNLFKQKSGE